jgi:hypothetical protein
VDYGAQILQQLQQLNRDAGEQSAGLTALRREFERARDESGDRHKELREDMCALSESSERRSVALQELRALVARCPVHRDPDREAPDVPSTALVRDEETAHRRARRSVLQSLAALLTAVATLVGGWWASRPPAK